ncbi:25063_t:CDS:2 [Dentiscutata erythropus]|uniref:25063_t:CDS:1 n=1 Tax=Dentiscutata erythropus TaxID=1348616 RepID=A0A9N9E5D8_9GLOM|nr:25063_t:CDS:2 [Dentiscutata erythropus]
MGRKQHRLTNLFIILDEKANKSNKFSVCKFCIKGSTYEEAYENRITNTQRECRRHLISCQYFIAEYPSEIMRNKVLNPTLTNKDPQESESESESEQTLDQLGLNITLDGYFQKPLSSKQKEKLEQLLLKATVSCGWAFTWVDNPEIKELFYYINPTIKLPNRQTLSGRILTKTAKNSIELQKKDIQADQLGVTLTYDGWKNIKKESLLEIALINSSGKTLIWGTEDISGKRTRWPEIVKITNDLFIKLEEDNIKVNCLVTDSASEFMAARSRLRTAHLDKIFIPYFAHQMNLAVGDIFRYSSILSTVAEEAIKIVTFFNRSTFFLGRLRDEQSLVYKNKYISLLLPNATRWNSHYYCFSSLIKTRTALKNLGNKIEEGLDNSFSNFPEDILMNILDSNWWTDLRQLEAILLPYCSILNKLQCDQAKLHDVLHGFGWIVQVIENLSDLDLRTNLLMHIERRWQTWEQPLLILSFLLHPEYRLVWMESEVLLQELQQYREQKYLFRDKDYCQFKKKDDILSFWNFVSRYTEELHLVAQRIFSISAKKNFIQTQTAMHATLSNDDHESNNMESEDEIGFIERQEDISSINDWKEAVNEWNSLIEEEGMEAISEDEEAISELNEEEDAISELNEELAEPDIDNHPAIASSAKWKLETLFDKNNLKHPPYIKLLTE